MSRAERFNTPENLALWATFVGQKVQKKSGKPFKSKDKINTVKSFGFIHPHVGTVCFLFEEDDTYVECIKCELA